MARKFLTALDLGKNELQNAVVQNLAGAPGSPAKGQLYMNSSDNTLYWWDGSQWIAAKAAAGATPAGTVTGSGVGDTGIVGVSTNFAREDHRHSREVYGNPTATTTFGLSAVNGSANSTARSDHTHGTPTHDAAAHSTISLSALAAPTAQLNMGGFKVSNLGPPVVGTDGTTKDYVDNLSAGLSWKDSVRVASVANHATLSGLLVVDGVTTVAGDRVLLKNQTTASTNGIYTASAGVWGRAKDADLGTEIPGTAVFVEEGTQADTAWLCTTNAPITVDTTALTFVQFGAGTSYSAGAGLTMNGSTIDVVPTDTTLVANPDTLHVNTAVIASRAYVDGGTYLGAGNGLTGTGATLNVVGDASITVTTDQISRAALTGDVTAAAGANATTIANGVVTNAKLANMPANSIRGNNTGSAAVALDLTVAQVKTLLAIANTDVSGLGPFAPASKTTIVSADITDGTIANGDLATMPANTFKGNNTGATAVPLDLTVAQMRTALSVLGKYSQATVGGATSQVITHNLNTRDCICSVYRTLTPWDEIECDIEFTSVNTVTLRFAVAPATNEYSITVIG